MAQISYGTITITDTNDIESIIIEYARNQSTSSAPTSGWSTTRPAWEQGYYIWQHTRTHKAGTDPSTDDIGTAVCITGSTGQTGGTGAAGRSLTNTVTQYTTATNSATITQSNMGSYTWNSNVPSYSSSTPAYWVRVTNTYSNPSSTVYIIYKDNGLTDAIAKSVEANNNAAIANSIAQHANEDAQGAMSQAADAQYQTGLLAARVKNYWWDSTGAHIASGIVRSGQTEADDVDENNSNTYGFNSLVGLGSLIFGYNSYKAVELNGGVPALYFYQPSKTTQGNVTIALTGNELKFYNPVSSTPSDANVKATLNSSGLTINDGTIQLGSFSTAATQGYVYLSTHNASHTINGILKDDWRLVLGDRFAVTKEGYMVASEGLIGGEKYYIKLENDTTTEQSFNQSSLEICLNKLNLRLDDIYGRENIVNVLDVVSQQIDFISLWTGTKAWIYPLNGYNYTVYPYSDVEGQVTYYYDSYEFSNNTVYIRSSDTSVDADKDYYEYKNNAYSLVTNPTGSPSDKTYYELITGQYVLSTDTTVNTEKNYYTRSGNSTTSYVYTNVTNPSGNPSTNSYYELVQENWIQLNAQTVSGLDSMNLMGLQNSLKYTTDSSNINMQRLVVSSASDDIEGDKVWVEIDPIFLNFAVRNEDMQSLELKLKHNSTSNTGSLEISHGDMVIFEIDDKNDYMLNTKTGFRVEDLGMFSYNNGLAIGIV